MVESVGMSEDSLEKAILALQGWADEKGRKLDVKPTMMQVPVEGGMVTLRKGLDPAFDTWEEILGDE